MGIKKITPEERLLNLIKKNVSSPAQENTAAPLSSPITNVRVSAPSLPVRRRFRPFLIVLFFVFFFLALVFLFINQDGVSFKMFPFKSSISSSGIKLMQTIKSSFANKTPESGPSEVNVKPSLIRIDPPIGYVLSGVIIGEPLSAIIRNTRTDEMLTLEIGDTLLQYTLTRIEKGKITFEDSHNTFTLAL